MGDSPTCKDNFMKRRTFIGGAAALAISTTAFADILRRPLANLNADHPYVDNIGIQLWTVRNELEMDKLTTLTAIKEAGYKQVELMNVIDSGEVVTIAKDLDLGITSAHFNWETVINPSDAVPTIEAVIEKAGEIGLKYLVLGYIGPGHRESADHFKAHADSVSIAGEKCHAAGIQLCYHNHAFEFKPLEDEVTGFELFIERFHRDFVMFELDVFWSRLAGQSTLKILDQLDGRVAQVHLKDLKKGTKKQFDESKVTEDIFVPLGQGGINMAKVMAACQKVGVVQCHVEQDHSPNPIESFGISIAHLNDIASGKIEEKKKAEKAARRAAGEAHDDPFGG